MKIDFQCEKIECYKIIFLLMQLQSNLSTMTNYPWDPKKWALFRGWGYSQGLPIKLVFIRVAWGLGWLLLTGGR